MQTPIDAPKPEMEGASEVKRHRLLASAGLIVFAIGAYLFFRDYLNFRVLADNHETLRAFRREHYILAVLIFVLCYQVLVLLSLPGATLATLTGGYLFGLGPGLVFNVLSATSGACLLFLAARWGMGNFLASKIDSSEGKIARIRKGLEENEISFLLLIRLIPVVPFFVANLVPAMTGIRFSRFALTTLVGIIPGSLVYTWVGVGLGEVLGRGEKPDLGIIFQPNILLPILGLSLLAALPIVMRIIRKKDAL